MDYKQQGPQYFLSAAFSNLFDIHLKAFFSF